MRRALLTFGFSVFLSLFQFIAVPTASHAEGYTYDQLRTLLRAGKASEIKQVEFANDMSLADVQFAGSNEVKKVDVPFSERKKLVEGLRNLGVKVIINEHSTSLIVQSMVVPLVLMIVIFGFLKLTGRIPQRKQ